MYKQEKGKGDKCFVRRMPEGAQEQLQVREQLFWRKQGPLLSLESLWIGQFWKIILERGSTTYRCTGVEKDKECLGKFRIMPGAKEREDRL